MQRGQWKFFGVTYKRSGAQEDDIKVLELTSRATDKLVGIFAEEVGQFVAREEVSYTENPVYKPDKEDEVLVIEDFDLPEELYDAASSWHRSDPLEPADLKPENMKVLMGVMFGEGERTIAFKKMNQSRILDREAAWFHWDENTYDAVDGPGFVLPEGLVAVFAEKKLYFNNDRDVSSFLDLASHFRGATRAEIDQLLSDEPIKWRGEGDFHKLVSKRCKRLMYVFMLNGGFTDEFSVEGVQQVAGEVGIMVTPDVEDGREILILPESAKDITHVFEILTHHYSPGIWDGLWRRYNSSQIVPGQRRAEDES